MELVKHTPEEQAQIDQDKSRPHVAVVVLVQLEPRVFFQTVAAEMLESATVEIKRRADAARMLVLSTSLATNVVNSNGGLFLSVTLLCQWAEIEKLEEQQRRAFLAGGGGVPPGRRGA